jgi:hypothetical protein
MIEGHGLFGCELEPNLTQMDLETVAGSKCGFRLISSWREVHSSLRTTDMQEIVGCRGLQRSERTRHSVPVGTGGNTLKSHRVPPSKRVNGFRQQQSL